MDTSAAAAIPNQYQHKILIKMLLGVKCKPHPQHQNKANKRKKKKTKNAHTIKLERGAREFSPLLLVLSRTQMQFKTSIEMNAAISTTTT